MTRMPKLAVLVAVGVLSLPAQQAGRADDGQEEGGGHHIQVDIPVRLEKADVVFNMNHLVLRGDLPLGMRYMDLMAKNFKEAGTKGEIIGVFYNEAGHLTLNDKAYNAARNVATGNPYKDFVAELLNQGVRIEECAETMKAHKWGNEDLLPGVRVNEGAVLRLVQLSQQGFVQIQP